jgi:hypothetical protein
MKTEVKDLNPFDGKEQQWESFIFKEIVSSGIMYGFTLPLPVVITMCLTLAKAIKATPTMLKVLNKKTTH